MILDMQTNRALPDRIKEYLTVWGALLGSLAWESYTSIVVLLRADKRRAAFALSRSLTDYYIRLRFYALQAASTDREKPAEFQAVNDWNALDETLLDFFAPATTAAGPTTSLEAIAEALARVDASKRTMPAMLQTVYPDDPATRNHEHAWWLMRSAILDGDQLSRIELMDEVGRNGNVAYALRQDARFGAAGILSNATMIVLGLMHEFSQITGRQYALNVLVPKYQRLFP